MTELALFLFERTGNMARPWLEAGYDVLCLDIEHSVRTPPAHSARCDLTTLGPALSLMSERGYSPADVIFMGASPPCTDVACSGARDLARKGLRALSRSLEMFATAQEMASLIRAPWYIENPRSTVSTYWRKADQRFHPHQFTLMEPADNYTKETWLWTGGGFVMPDPCPDLSLPPPDDRIHKAPPSRDRGAERSAAPMGFSRAVFEANRPGASRD